jgi:hypothetical protein
MIEISTPSSNSIFKTESTPTESQKELSEDENEFYNMIKPLLNQIVKEPAEKIVRNILAFSKSI